jgi:enoyl-CoA hydratase/carnithine racemase
MLARPPANALDIETTEEMADAFEALAADDAASAVVLTGEGKAFCAVGHVENSASCV